MYNYIGRKDEYNLALIEAKLVSSKNNNSCIQANEFFDNGDCLAIMQQLAKGILSKSPNGQ